MVSASWKACSLCLVALAPTCGRDTVEANVDLGLPVDAREYGIAAQIFKVLTLSCYL